MTQETSIRVRSMEERKALLSQNIATEVAQGGRVESQSDTMAVIVKGKKVNHLLHFIIGVCTLGMWWVVWLLLVLTGGEKRRMVSVDEYGNVLNQKV